MNPFELAVICSIIIVVTLCVMAAVHFVILLMNIVGVLKKKPIDTTRLTPLVFFALTSGAIIGLSIIGLSVSIIWWLFLYVNQNLTPSELFIYSLLFGIFPIFITVLGSLLSKLLNCKVSAADHDDCYVLSMNVGPLLYKMFMSFYLVFITGPLALIGVFFAVIKFI